MNGVAGVATGRQTLVPLLATEDAHVSTAGSLSYRRIAFRSVRVVRS